MLHAKNDNRQIEPNISNMKNIRLYSYIMTHDTGFSPNPFHGVCTLACCKPRIRKNIGECFKKKEDKKFDFWVVGISSLNQKENGHKLVYAMRITKVLTFEEYWNDPRYKLKKPNLLSIETIDKAGDNIYKPLKKNAKLYTDFEQITNKHHINENAKIHDISGINVLISNDFYYFGKDVIDISKQPLYNHYNKKYPPRTKYNFDNKEKEKFISFVKKVAEKKECICPGIYAYPHKWENKQKETISKNLNTK